GSVPEGRQAFRTGDVLCFQGKGSTSALVRWLTCSPYSHVGLVYRLREHVYCLEAVGVGVRLIILPELVRRYRGGIDYFTVRDVTPQQRRGAVGFAFEQLGKLYNAGGLLRFVPFLLLGAGRRVRARSRAQGLCSGMVNEAYRRQGVVLVPQTSAYVTPADLASSPRLQFRFRVKERRLVDLRRVIPERERVVDLRRVVPGKERRLVDLRRVVPEKERRLVDVCRGIPEKERRLVDVCRVIPEDARHDGIARSVPPHGQGGGGDGRGARDRAGDRARVRRAGRARRLRGTHREG